MDINTCFATTIDYRDLALYSHLIPAAAAFILGFFAYLKAENRNKAAIFLVFTVCFALWLLWDLVVWTSDSYGAVAAIWAPLDYIEVVFFLVLFYFVYTDFFVARNHTLEGLIALAAAVPFVITLLGQAVLEFYQPMCEMEGNRFLANYKVWLEGLILFCILAMGIYKAIKQWGRWHELTRVGLVTIAIVLFMGVFGGSEYVATSTDIFEINLYALFTLPIFILMLTMAITSYGTFKLGDTAVRVLFYVFLILAATQFFFVGDLTEFLLAAMSFGVVLTLGLMLFLTSEREIRQRHIIEVQEKELQVINKQQENLLAFISHEVKGYLAKSAAAYAGILQGDYGKVPVKLETMADSGLIDMRKGVDMVGDVLDASNLRKGTVAYDKKPFDFKKSVEEVVHDLKPMAEKKGVSLDFSVPAGTYEFTGDEAKIRRHVIRNLIDNSIHYTQTGNIQVSLSRSQDFIHFSVKDTGVGITKEDMQNLFTEGGKGRESIKMNVDSTGYGLFIAKQVTEAHSGKISAHSKGKGQGSEFVVELPTS